MSRRTRADLAASRGYGTSFGTEEKEFADQNIRIDVRATIERHEFLTSGKWKPLQLDAMQSTGLAAMVRDNWTDANVQRDPPFGFEREEKTQAGVMLYLISI